VESVRAVDPGSAGHLAGRRVACLAGALSLLLAGCLASPAAAPPGSPDTPAAPSSTSPAAPADAASATPPPLTESTAAIIIEPPVPIPSATLEPPTVGVSQEELAIFLPGPGSQAISPLPLQGYGGPSRDNRLELRLIGEDGRLMTRGFTILYSYPGRPGLFYGTLPFETDSVAELAWLQVRSYGERYGLLKHLTSVPVTLLTSGSARIERSLHGPEKLTLFTPVEDTNVRGPQLHIEGAGWLDADQPLGVEVLDLRGNALATAEVDLQAPAIGALGTFELDLTLSVPRSQWIRVAVFERGSGALDLLHYASVQVWFIP